MELSKFEEWVWKGAGIFMMIVALSVFLSSTLQSQEPQDTGVVYVGKDGRILEFDSMEELIGYLIESKREIKNEGIDWNLTDY